MLLESGSLILRGELRKRLPLQHLSNVRASAGRLCFTVGREPVQLVLGVAASEKWAEAINTPPPPLSAKLGITSKTVVRVIGNIHDEALNSALAAAARISATGSDLIVACVDTPEFLEAVLRQAESQLLSGIPIWIVYAKGPGHPLNESVIRSALRLSGMIDTKVACVSPSLTALRFNRRKQ